MEIVNRTRGQVLAARAEVARSMGARMKGLLGRDGLEDGGGLLIEPCNSIHTFFMRFPIDVLFVDEAFQVVRQLEALAPWRLTGIYLRAQRVIELPAGVIRATGTEVGDQLLLREG